MYKSVYDAKLGDSLAARHQDGNKFDKYATALFLTGKEYVVGPTRKVEVFLFFPETWQQHKLHNNWKKKE